MSVSYRRQVHPPLKRTTRVRFPSPIRKPGFELIRTRIRSSRSPCPLRTGLPMSLARLLGSSCWAPRWLIPVRAMVRFHQLLLLAFNRRSPTRNQSWFESSTIHPMGRTPMERHFPCKGKGASLSWLRHSSAKNFLTASDLRGASGEAMTHRGGSAMSPVVKRERTLGSIPSTATETETDRRADNAVREAPRDAIVPRTGRSATNAVARVQFLPVVRGDNW